MKTHGTGERVTLGASTVEKDLGVLVDTDLKYFPSKWRNRSTKQLELLVSLVDHFSFWIGTA